MPWVKEDMCTGCGTCVEECPSGAVALQEGKAAIDDAECIRCGRCHDVCPEEAVRHDGERIPQEVEANVRHVVDLAKRHEGRVAKDELVDRWTRHFQKEMKVADETLKRLESV
jgi:ferredoxin